MTTRRRFLRGSAVAGAASTLTWLGHAQDAPRVGPSESGAELVTPETEAAADRGLSFLARAQQDDGAYLDRFSSPSVGITALAALALMGAGHHPGRGRYGRHVSRAADFVLAAGAATGGYLSGAEGNRFAGGQTGMYNHGFAALFLSEALGTFPDPARQAKARDALDRAAAYTVSAQGRDGGWRYEPNPPTSDVSVTVAQMMALRAARNAGVFVRKGVVDRAVQFVRGCQTADGGFSYFKGQGGSAFARSAAAVVGLYSAGVYDGDDVARGLRYVDQFRPVPGGVRETHPQHYYYGQYYAALAMWTAGRDHWAKWFPAVRDDLLGKARGGPGGWNDPYHGPAYATAMSLIVLQLPNNYLPILQR